MLGDKLLFKPEHDLQAEEVIKKLDPKKRKTVILIGGTSGTGKTETAQLVQQKLYQLGTYSVLLSLDDYYDTFWNERDSIRKSRGIEQVGISEINWSDLIAAISSFRDNAHIAYNRVNKYSEQIERIITRSAFQVFIIEGLYALYLYKFADVVHHIEGDPESTYAFRKERGKENPDDEWRKQIIQKEYEEVMRLRKAYYGR